MSDLIKPISHTLPRTNPIAPPPLVNKVTDTAQQAVDKHITRTPLTESISSRTNKNKASEKISLVITPLSTSHSISTPQLMDLIVKYRGVHYRATYRLKEGETTPDDFEDYLLAILEGAHKNAELDPNPQEQTLKKELLKKPFFAQDAGENAYSLSALSSHSTTSILLEIPPRYISHREKMEPFTLTEYQTHTERSLNGFFPSLAKATTNPSPHLIPPPSPSLKPLFNDELPSS